MESSMSIQTKEQLIIGTILSANKEMSKFLNDFGSNSKTGKEMKNLMESQNSLYHYNMSALFSQISNINFIQLNESFNSIMDQNSYIKNPRNNYYAYFQKVEHFLSGFELNLQKSLNENLVVSDTSSENPIQSDIYSFKNDLKKVIQQLEKSNDLDIIPSNILKIKTFAKQPIFVCGYNICGNLALKKELYEKFEISDQNLLAICFDKSNKQLLFITINTSKLIVYDLKEDKLDHYNNINTNEKIVNTQIKPKLYLEKIKELIHNNIVEVYFNADSLQIKFTDNLYCDNQYADYVEKMQHKINQTVIIKK